MIEIFIACLGILALILLSEQLWRKKKIKVETSRKIIHMGTGIIVAFLPFYVDWIYIQLLSIALLAGILLSYKLHVLNSIHAVKRITRGEVLYPIGIGICAFLEPAPWIFTAAILHLALADGLAGVVGVKWGKPTRYHILSHGKSFVGSMAFFYTSMAIFAAALWFVSPQTVPTPFILLIVFPTILTLLENISWFGSDNVTVPIAVILLLSTLP